MGIPLRIQGYLWDMVKPNSLSEAGGWIFVYYPENVDRSTHMNWLMIQPEQINWQHLFGYGPKNSWAVVVLDIAHLIHEVRDKLNTYSAVN
jgi:hypothetical protein